MDEDPGVAHALNLQRRLNENPGSHGRVIKEFFDERERAGDKAGAAYALVFLNLETEKKKMPMEQASPILKIMVVLGFVAGIIFAGFGVWLVYLGASGGQTEFSFFGQTFKSANAGIAAIFIGGAVVVLLARAVLKTIRDLK